MLLSIDQDLEAAHPPSLRSTHLSCSPPPTHTHTHLAAFPFPPLTCLQEDTSLSKVYTLFRTLGLRHICVIPRWACVCLGGSACLMIRWGGGLPDKKVGKGAA